MVCTSLTRPQDLLPAAIDVSAERGAIVPVGEEGSHIACGSTGLQIAQESQIENERTAKMLFST